MPTARPPAHLSGAATLAKSLGCILVTLHSKKWTTAAEARKRLPADLNLIAVNVRDTARLNLPDWRTTDELADSVFACRSDLSTKRNLALALSRMLGWSRILFLDDDITGLKPDDVRAAANLLDTYNAVGLHVGGFPDHSVVCHAYQMAGGRQQEFVGGGALAIEVNRSKSFFPGIYNDDWFFLLDGNDSLQSTAVTGEVIQQPYDRSGPRTELATRNLAMCWPRASTGAWTRTSRSWRPTLLGRLSGEAPPVHRGCTRDGQGGQ